MDLTIWTKRMFQTTWRYDEESRDFYYFIPREVKLSCGSGLRAGPDVVADVQP